MRPQKWIAAALLLASACSQRNPPAPNPFADARAAVTAQLRDPDSAEFDGLYRTTAGTVCGMVNARNGFGGMTGAEPFAYAASASPEVLLYEFHGPLGGWRERGELAQGFAARGCSIGADQQQALDALREMNRQPPEK